MAIRIIEAAPGSDTGERKVKILERAPDAAPKVEPRRAVFDPLHDVARAFAPMIEQGKADVAKMRAGQSAASLNPFENPAIAAPIAALQALSNQFTGPASRAMGRSGLPIYEPLAAPGSAGFGKPTRKLEGADRDRAFEDVLNTALAGVRSVAPLRVGPPKPTPARVVASKAEKRVGAAVERAIQRDAMTAADVLAKTEKGTPSFQAGGENLVSLAEVAAQSPGPARPILRQAARDYSATAPKRTKADIGTSLGGKGDYLDTLDTLIQTRKTDATKGIKAIEAAPVRLDENSVLALRSDLAKGAIRDRAQNSLASPDPAVREAGARLNRLAADVLDKPGDVAITLRDAQDISRSLQQSASAAYRAGDGGRGEALSSLGKAIRSNASDTQRGGVSGYAEWLKKYGDDVSNEEALELGANVFKKENSAAAIRKQLKDAGDAERDLFRKGVGEALLDRVRQKGDVAELRGLLKNEEFGDRIALAFPDDASFAGFMESAAKRVAEQDRNNQVFGGSPTYSRQAARADLETEGGEAMDTALDVVTLNAKSLGKKAAQAGLKGRRASILTDPKMNEMLGKVMSDPDELTALLNLLQAARASSASRASIARQAALPALTTSAAQKEN